MYHPRDRVQTPTSWKAAFGSSEASLLVSKAKGVEICFSDRDEDGVGSGSGSIYQFTINSSLTLARVFFQGGMLGIRSMYRFLQSGTTVHAFSLLKENSQVA